MESINAKNALVIGGGSGMGAASALLLAQNGARVAISGRTEENLREVSSRATQGRPWTSSLRTLPMKPEKTLYWFDGELGNLDILVNAAGISVPNRAIAELSGKDWDAVVKTNLTGAFDCIKLALDRMRPRVDGLIVMINSISGKRSNPLGGVAYNASKFGMTALGACVSEEERKAESGSPASFPEKSIPRF